MESRTLVLLFSVCIWGFLEQVNGFHQDHLYESQNFKTPESYDVRDHNTYDHSPEPIVHRPCSQLDLACIQNYFQQHAKCNRPSELAIPNPCTRRFTGRFLPFINTTLLLVAAEISDLNGRVVDFYLNPKTDKAVLVVNFDKITIDSEESYFRIHRNEKEPVVAKDYTSGKFGSITITAIISNIANMQLDTLVSSAYVSNRKSQLVIGPKVAHSKDPAVRAVAAGILTNTEIFIQEFFENDAFYITTFILHKICDFGLRF